MTRSLPIRNFRRRRVRILDRIHPAATKYTFIPLGSRGAVIAAVRGLREQVSERTFGVSILGVVDADRETPTEEGIVAWPYASIENLLLADSIAISRAVETVAGLIVTPQVIGKHLKDVARQMREDEIRLRVMEGLRPRTLRFGGSRVADVQSSMRSAASQLRTEANDASTIQGLVDSATRLVDDMISDGSYRRGFRGKRLLHGLLGRLALHNIPYNDFLYALADASASSAGAQRELRRAFRNIDAARASRLEQILATPTDEASTTQT